MSAVYDTPIRTSAQNLDRVLAAARPMALVFEIPGCAPCQSLEPTLTQLARDYAGRALIVRVEDANEGNLATRFRLTSAPTLIFWQNGKEIARIEGAADAAAIRSYMEFLIGAGNAPAPTTGPAVPLRGQAAPPPSSKQQPPSSKENGQPVVVTDASFGDLVLMSPLPVLVDFWAPWCGPCRMVSPIVEELGRAYAGRLRVAKVNTDENPMNASRLGIMGIPTLIFFKNGREVDRVVGAVPKPTLQSRLEKVLNS